MKVTFKEKIVLENDWTNRITKVLEMEKIPAGADVSYFYNDTLNETVIYAKYEKEVIYAKYEKRVKYYE